MVAWHNLPAPDARGVLPPSDLVMAAQGLVDAGLIRSRWFMGVSVVCFDPSVLFPAWRPYAVALRLAFRQDRCWPMLVRCVAPSGIEVRYANRDLLAEEQLVVETFVVEVARRRDVKVSVGAPPGALVIDVRA